jgi:hypothetical protein
MTSVNTRTKWIFVDRADTAPALRTFTYDEAVFVGSFIEVLAQRNSDPPRQFTVRDLLGTLGECLDLPRPDNYLRPALDFLQRLVNAGILTETPSRAGTHSLRSFQGGVRSSLLEWALGLGVAAFGTQLIAHIYGDVTVRVHVRNRDVENVASGVVLYPNAIVTNAHVLREGDVSVSWGDRPAVPAERHVVHTDPNIDLAVIFAPGFEANPVSFLRAPRAPEEVIVLAYPLVPQVTARPLLRFIGNIASDEPLNTYFGEQQMIVCAVMGPGASGGPIFSSDGHLVGLVVQKLEGTYMTETGRTSETVFHAAIPGDLLLRELPTMDPAFRRLNQFGPGEEAGEILARPNSD